MSDHREPWASDADPGDETDEPGEDFEYTIDFQPDEALTANLNSQAVCPKGHVCEVRESDGALWCSHPSCDCAYYKDFAGLIYPRPTPPPDEKAA
jgi:hypothetical protein